MVTGFAADRPVSDERTVRLTWDAVPGAEGYMIYWGAKGSGLFLHYQVIGAAECQINALNMGVEYEFAIAAYNAGGVGARSAVITAAATQPVPERPVPEPIPEAQQPEKAEGYAVYEAEDAEIGGGAFVARGSGEAGASGGAAIQNMHNDGAYFELKNIDGGPGGDAVLRLVYANGNQQAHTEIFLNGESLGNFLIPGTNGWDRFMRVDIPLSGFTAGATNTIRFNGGQEGFNPDFIQVIY
jgi:hypothetical protein